jgi:hypothetical protein
MCRICSTVALKPPDPGDALSLWLKRQLPKPEEHVHGSAVRTSEALFFLLSATIISFLKSAAFQPELWLKLISHKVFWKTFLQKSTPPQIRQLILYYYSILTQDAPPDVTL